MGQSITVVLRDPVTGAGLPGQDVTLRVSPFAATTYTMTDVPGKAGSYKYDDYASGVYKLYVNGTEDKSFGGNNGRSLFQSGDLLFKSGGTMTGDINMGGNGIINLKTPLNDYDAVTKLFLASFYLALTGGVMSGDLSMDGNRLTDLPDTPVGANEGISWAFLVELLSNYLLLDGSEAMTGDLDTDGHKITGLPNPVGDTEPVPLAYSKTIFPRMTAGALDQNIYAQWTFRTLVPYILGTPVNPFHTANVKFVKDYVNNYLNGISPTYQQTETLILVDFNCTQENNRRYTKLEAAMLVANGYASSDRRMTVFVEGSGNDDTSLVTDYNKFFVTAVNDYVDIMGINQSVILEMEDTTYTATSLGLNILQDMTLNCPDSANVILENYILRNVKFARTAGAASGGFTLDGCIVENCSKSTATVATTGCIGEIVDLTNSKTLLLSKVQDEGGAYDVIFSNGDIQGKRILGRQGSDVVSANNITLGNGNAFVITGNTQVNLISSSGWTSGSVITLQFSGTPTVKHLYAPSGVNKAINWKSGADKVMTGGEVFMLVLSWDTNYWTEV